MFRRLRCEAPHPVRDVRGCRERTALEIVTREIGDDQVVEAVVLVAGPWDEVVHLRPRRLSHSGIAVKAPTPLDLPEAGPYLDRLNPIRTEQEGLELRLLQAIELGDHRGPATLDQRPQ